MKSDDSQAVATQETLRVLVKYSRALSAALKARDPYTRYHCERVVQLAVDLGRYCALSEHELVLLEFSAGFHDIGKIGIPDHILLKEGPLTPDEWVVMQNHSDIGARILLETELDFAAQIASIIRHHHERFDGSGYPDGLKGTDIPLLARILAVADSYDALGSHRVYHPATGHGSILEIIETESGAKHDPDLVEAFCRMMHDRR